MSLHAYTLRLLYSLLLSSGLLLSSSQAQVTTTITPDGTLGTVVTQSGTVHNITGGTRPGNGPNLFHSFDRFSVGTNDTARFSGPTGIVNILSRVTGGQQSDIDGRLQSTILGANLYLLNPSGVLFGANASLDVSGSFHVSTADVLRFADGATFSAHLGEKSTLTVAAPAAFGFLGSTPAPITIQGSALQVSEGKTLSVVGGDIQIVGGELVAPSGRIQLASVASPGEVLFSSLELTPDLQVDSFTRLGRLELSQGGLLDVSGNRGGTVLIRSGRLLVDQAQIFANTLGDVNGASLGLDLQITADAVMAHGALLTTDSKGAGRGGDVRLMASSVSLDDAVIASRPNASGAGGNVGLHVGNLMLTGGAEIDSSSVGSGRGGDLTVVATEAISLMRNNSQNDSRGLFSNASSLGDGGHLSISAPTLTMDGMFIQAGTAFGSRGNAGGATVQVGRLTLTGGAQIDTNTRGSGHGGDLTVSATDAISLTGPNSALFSNTFGSGDTGRMSISTPILTMDGGQIQAAVDSQGSGNARGITIEVEQLALTGGAQIDTSSFGAGRGGQLTITAKESISLADSSLLSNAFGAREAGGLTVETGKLVLTDGALIDSSSFGAGPGGKLTVTAKESISISGRVDKPTGLFSTAHSDGNSSGLVVSAPTLAIQEGLILTNGLNAQSGHAGDLTLDVGTLVLTNGAKIRSDTRGPGAGGKLTVTAKESITISGQDRDGDPSGLFSTTSSSGNAGGLMVSTPILIVQGGLIFTNSQGAVSGDAGNLTLEVGKLVLTDGAQIDSGTTGRGRSGNLSVRAKDSIAIAGHDSEGSSSGLFSTASGRGEAGSITVEAGSLTLTDGATIMSGGPVIIRGDQLVMDNSSIKTSASGSGRGGDIAVEVGNTTLTGNAAINSGGDLFIRGRQLVMDSSFIDASSSGDADGGRIALDLTGALAMSNFGGITAATLGHGHGGSISVQAKSITLTGGAEINSTTDGAGQGGDLRIIATDFIFISGRSSQSVLSGLVANAQKEGQAGNIFVSTPTLTMDDGSIQAMTLGDGNAGEIRVQVGSLTLRGGAQISNSSGGLNIRTGKREVGRGQGGNLIILADDAIAISGRDIGDLPSGIFAETSGSGNTGRIFISAPTLKMVDGRLSSTTTGDGRAGDLMIEVGSLTLDGGAQIASNSGVQDRVGRGQGGQLTITAKDLIAISGHDSKGVPSGIFASTFGSGDAGNISLAGSVLKMEDGGEIQAGTSGGGRAGDVEMTVGSLSLTGGAQINTSTTGTGQGGNVKITATDRIAVSGRDSQGFKSGMASGTGSPGRGGNIELQAREIELSNDGTILASSSGQGDAGNIIIQAGKLFRSRNGAVTTEAETADGGNITLIAGSRVELRDSQITTTVQSGVGKGGNITFDPQFIVLQRSQMRADAFGGPGGNVHLIAEVFLADPLSQVSASSVLGINGVVNIQAPVTSISGAVAPLPQSFAQAAELLRDRCAERLRGGTVSRFVLGGRDGVPREPGSLLLSPPVQGEQSAPAPMPDTAAGQREASFVPVRGLEALDVACARWRGTLGIGGTSGR
jgi:filamentous hemagglutinin family protein